MDTAIWVVQGLLAFAFFMAGVSKLLQTREALKERNQAWVEDFSDQQVKGIGLLEIAGALGLILPMLLDIVPVLTPLAAIGLALTMAGAALTHLRRSENPMIVVNVILLALAIFVAYGRLVAEPVV